MGEVKRLMAVLCWLIWIVDTDEGAEKVMLSYGYGASIPASSQRRMKQSVHLARRCLALERQMVSDKRQIQEQEEAISELKQQVVQKVALTY